VGPGGGLRARGSLWVEVTVSQARFVHTERIRLIVGTEAGPTLAHLVEVPPDVSTHHWAGTLELGPADTYILVVADGDQAIPIEQTGSYLREKWKLPGVTPFAIAGPILVDTDDDGRWKRGATDIPLP